MSEDWPMPRIVLVGLLAALVAFVLGVLFGHFLPRAQTVEITKEVAKTVLVEDTAAQAELVELRAQVETLRRHTQVITTTLDKPDGTRRTRTVVDAREERSSEAHVQMSESGRSQASTAIASESEHESHKTTTFLPQWRLGPMVGLDWHSGQRTYGGLVERRILGPISLGVWGLSSGQAGAVVTAEF